MLRAVMNDPDSVSVLTFFVLVGYVARFSFLALGPTESDRASNSTTAVVMPLSPSGASPYTPHNHHLSDHTFDGLSTAAAGICVHISRVGQPGWPSPQTTFQ